MDTMEPQRYHMRMAVDPHFEPTEVRQQITTAAGQVGLLIDSGTTLNNWGKEYEGIDTPHSYRALFTVELCSLFFEGDDTTNIRTILPSLIVRWLDVVRKSANKSGTRFEELLQVGLRLYPLSVYYIEEGIKTQFTFDLAVDHQQILPAWEKMATILQRLRSQDAEIIDWMNTVRRQKNNMCFLAYQVDQAEWKLIDRLADASLRLSVAYRKSINDDRIRKPYIVFNEENYNQYTYFDNQWNLKLDKETIIMPQPNDISLYVRLMDSSLKKGEKFYLEEHTKRSGQPHMPLLHTEDFIKYYDYFETIIAAIIFSYTSIETMVNIAIPDDFIHVEQGKGKKQGVETHYPKEAIERNFSLQEKLRRILPKVLNCPDPITEQWWNDFTDLENIRNEVIHTKQSKSEERYSFFLSMRIFEVIRCNVVIIKYYGEFINKHQKKLLFDYPYGFGYDAVPASFMSNEDFKSHYENLYNPWRPKDKGDKGSFNETEQ